MLMLFAFLVVLDNVVSGQTVRSDYQAESGTHLVTIAVSSDSASCSLVGAGCTSHVRTSMVDADGSTYPLDATITVTPPRSRYSLERIGDIPWFALLLHSTVNTSFSGAFDTQALHDVARSISFTLAKKHERFRMAAVPTNPAPQPTAPPTLVDPSNPTTQEQFLKGLSDLSTSTVRLNQYVTDGNLDGRISAMNRDTAADTTWNGAQAKRLASLNASYTSQNIRGVWTTGFDSFQAQFNASLDEFTRLQTEFQDTIVTNNARQASMAAYETDRMGEANDKLSSFKDTQTYLGNLQKELAPINDTMQGQAAFLGDANARLDAVLNAIIRTDVVLTDDYIGTPTRRVHAATLAAIEQELRSSAGTASKLFVSEPGTVGAGSAPQPNWKDQVLGGDKEGFAQVSFMWAHLVTGCLAGSVCSYQTTPGSQGWDAEPGTALTHGAYINAHPSDRAVVVNQIRTFTLYCNGDFLLEQHGTWNLVQQIMAMLGPVGCDPQTTCRCRVGVERSRFTDTKRLPTTTTTAGNWNTSVVGAEGVTRGPAGSDFPYLGGVALFEQGTLAVVSDTIAPGKPFRNDYTTTANGCTVDSCYLPSSTDTLYSASAVNAELAGIASYCSVLGDESPAAPSVTQQCKETGYVAVYARIGSNVTATAPFLVASRPSLIDTTDIGMESQSAQAPERGQTLSATFYTVVRLGIQTMLAQVNGLWETLKYGAPPLDVSYADVPFYQPPNDMTAPTRSQIQALSSIPALSNLHDAVLSKLSNLPLYSTQQFSIASVLAVSVSSIPLYALTYVGDLQEMVMKWTDRNGTQRNLTLGASSRVQYTSGAPRKHTYLLAGHLDQLMCGQNSADSIATCAVPFVYDEDRLSGQPDEALRRNHADYVLRVRNASTPLDRDNYEGTMAAPTPTIGVDEWKAQQLFPADEPFRVEDASVSPHQSIRQLVVDPITQSLICDPTDPRANRTWCQLLEHSIVQPIVDPAHPATYEYSSAVDLQDKTWDATFRGILPASDLGSVVARRTLCPRPDLIRLTAPASGAIALSVTNPNDYALFVSVWWVPQSSDAQTACLSSMQHGEAMLDARSSNLFAFSQLGACVASSVRLGVWVSDVDKDPAVPTSGTFITDAQWDLACKSASLDASGLAARTRLIQSEAGSDVLHPANQALGTASAGLAVSLDRLSQLQQDGTNQVAIGSSTMLSAVGQSLVGIVDQLTNVVLPNLPIDATVDEAKSLLSALNDLSVIGQQRTALNVQTALGVAVAANKRVLDASNVLSGDIATLHNDAQALALQADALKRASQALNVTQYLNRMSELLAEVNVAVTKQAAYTDPTLAVEAFTHVLPKLSTDELFDSLYEVGIYEQNITVQASGTSAPADATDWKALTAGMAWPHGCDGVTAAIWCSKEEMALGIVLVVFQGLVLAIAAFCWDSAASLLEELY